MANVVIAELVGMNGSSRNPDGHGGLGKRYGQCVQEQCLLVRAKMEKQKKHAGK